LGYGDEGKGSLTDALVRKYNAKLVVRFNGGPQAAHNVVLPDGRHHEFHQFGSGTFAGAKTHLDSQMLIEPYALINEAIALERKGVESPLDLLSLDPDCLVITPWHWMMNRAMEIMRGGERHGSCGYGVGECRYDQIYNGLMLRVHDIGSTYGLKQLQKIKDNKLSTIRRMAYNHPEINSLFGVMEAEDPDQLMRYYDTSIGDRKIYSTRHRLIRNALMNNGPDVVFEGAQGVLLDEKWGFAPYNSWTDTTFARAVYLCESGDIGMTPKKIGVLRAYSTRHGMGPFVSAACPGEPMVLKGGEHNQTNPWQGSFRRGYFDMVAAQYALDCCGGVDTLAVTCLDNLGSRWPWIDEYMQVGNLRYRALRPDMTSLLMESIPADIHWQKKEDAIAVIEKQLNVRVGLTSSGPTHEGKVIHEPAHA
jgi:adenylosuccinate synthase